MTTSAVPSPDAAPKRLPKLKSVSLSVFHTMGGYYRVEIHGEDDLRDGPCNYAVMNIGIAWTKEEALAQARTWFEGLKDETNG